MYNAVGIVGAALILFGFYRVSIGKWTGRSKLYELDNLLGASLIAIYSLHHKAYINMVINLVWVIVAINGLSSYRERKK